MYVHCTIHTYLREKWESSDLTTERERVPGRSGNVRTQVGRENTREKWEGPDLSGERENAWEKWEGLDSDGVK